MSIRRNTITGTLWNVTRTFVVSVVEFVVYATLARYLTVEEFALLAFSLLVVEFANMLTTVGVNQNLIQREKWEQSYFRSVFTFILLLSFIISSFLAGAGGTLSYFYYSSEASLVILSLSLLPLFMALQSVYSAKLEREFLNKEITVIRTCTSIFFGVLTIILVLNSFGIWSIVISKILQHCVTLLLFMWRSKLPFELGINSLHIKEIKDFCLPLFGIALLNFFQSKGSNLLVGAALGAEKFAFISVSKKGYDILGQLTITSVNRMIVPSLSRVHSDNRVNRLYDIVYFSSLIVTPCYFGLGAVSEEFITLAFGEKYAASAIYLTLSTAAISGAIMAWYLPNLLISGGFTAAALKLKVVGFVRTMAVSGVTVWFGVEVMLASLTITTYLLLPVSFSITSKYFSISLVKMLKVNLPSIISSILMVSSIFLAKMFLVKDLELLFRLVALVCLGAMVYSLTLILFFRRDVLKVLQIAKSLRKNP
ncbi:oligosaccharide flippase family protein [Alteromonas macleodii]|uniref:Polysaccharide transport protein n=1 Tax=Alteromonas macleodii (strain English Channel 673) TaxID=1004788 RepID=A0AB32ZXG8_ALTME|nr:oligosaccharide flippase family protein [Alteromonas macleodii]AFT74187.1 putative polysaccharide transport protein [Alteromonas macleodii str. 'English Channel 673']MBL3810105.1 oligosaccharide flippase family protein [Alteromonas macleodii]MBL3883642.1 oligosaccharide flippase family protein [Alteromonas macleodii]